MRDKLLSRLYEAFDKSPDAVTGLVLTHANGVRWQISHRVLTIGYESGSLPQLAFSLDTGTVDQLAAALASAGIGVHYLNPNVGPLHPAVLLDGSGSQSQSNGNIILAFRSMLWAFISAYAKQVEDAKDQVPNAIAQAYLHSAQGEWLDFWGSYFGIARGAMGDDLYLTTIIRETLRPRSNALAIENAIMDATGFDVQIEEPWKEIFRLDSSLLSGHHGLYDGIRYGYHLIRPVAYSEVDWPVVDAVIERNRAAGVICISRASVHRSATVVPDEMFVTAKLTMLSKKDVLYQDRVFLDYMDDISDIAVVNYESQRLRGMLHASGSVILDEYLVLTLHSRTVHTNYAMLSYLGQYWESLPSWEYADETWTVNAMVSTRHSVAGPITVDGNDLLIDGHQVIID